MLNAGYPVVPQAVVGGAISTGMVFLKEGSRKHRGVQSLPSEASCSTSRTRSLRRLANGHQNPAGMLGCFQTKVHMDGSPERPSMQQLRGKKVWREAMSRSSGEAGGRDCVLIGAEREQ